MASSFGEAFAKSFQAEMARRKDAEAEVAREQRLEERAGRERALRIAEGIESEQRQNAAALSMFEKQGQMRSAQALADKEVLEADETIGISQKIPYNVPFDARANIASQRQQLTDWGKREAEDILRAEAGLKPLPPIKPVFVPAEVPQVGQEFGGLGGGDGEWVAGDIAPPTSAEVAVRVEAKRIKDLADKEREAFIAARSLRSSTAISSDANASATLEAMPEPHRSEVIQRYNSLVPKDARGEAVGAPQAGALAALVKAQMSKIEASDKAEQALDLSERERTINERRSAADAYMDLTGKPLSGKKISDDELAEVKKTHKLVQIRTQSPDSLETRTSYEWVPKARPAAAQTTGGIGEKNLGPRKQVSPTVWLREIFGGPKTD